MQEAWVALLRSLVRVLMLGWYFGGATIELMLHRPRNVSEGAEWLHRFCAKVMAAFCVKLTVEGEFPERGALISDHTSYLDIVSLAALKPVVFFSKAELEHEPIVGLLARSAGTVFVERGAGGQSTRARAGLKAAAEAGIPVVFYPEGTTTNGTHLLAFRSGLLGEALAAEEPVTAAHIRYTLDVDNGPGVSVEDDVCYWGDVSLLPHVLKFVGLRGVHVWVKIAGQPIAFSAAALVDRKLAAVEAREAVLALAGPGFYPAEAVEPEMTAK
jgi:1-acyl-sn-glycerol-3-phosphate acyltransferase